MQALRDISLIASGFVALYLAALWGVEGPTYPLMLIPSVGLVALGVYLLGRDVLWKH